MSVKQEQENSYPVASKTKNTIEGIMNRSYIQLTLEYSGLQIAISLIPSILGTLEGRKPATIAAVCFIKVHPSLAPQKIVTVMKISKPTLNATLKLIK